MPVACNYRTFGCINILKNNTGMRHFAQQRRNVTPSFVKRECGVSVSATAAPSAPVRENAVDTNGIIDVVIVGGGISGLTTALVCLTWGILNMNLFCV